MSPTVVTVLRAPAYKKNDGDESVMNVSNLTSNDSSGDEIENILQRLEHVEAKLDRNTADYGLTLLVFSGELDRLLAAFTMANAAAACGTKVNMFFTFWGTGALKQRTIFAGKGLMDRMFGLLMPGGIERRALSRLDMAGIGRRLIGREMKRKNISDLPALIDQAAALGVQIYVCQMSMNLMGITNAELIDYPHTQYCGAAKFLQLANASESALFV